MRAGPEAGWPCLCRPCTLSADSAAEWASTRSAGAQVGQVRTSTRPTGSDKPYLGSQVRRLAVPERLVAWSAAWPDYAPPDFSAAELNGKPYADPELDKGEFRFNQLDGPVDRRSFTG